MNPLAVIKFIVEHLQGTPYEPWVNLLLFLLLFAVVVSAIMFLLGGAGRRAIAKAVTAGSKAFLHRRKGYSPEWEAFRQRIEPYAELLCSSYFAFVGLYSASLVGVAALVAAYGNSKAPWWTYLVAVVWVLASFIYMRVNLESASWALHVIKTRKRG